MNLGLIPTVFLFFGVLSIIYGATLHLYLNIRDQRVVGHWSVGSLLWGVAILMTIFRVELPLLVSYFAANALAFVANVELNRALKVLARGERSTPVRRTMDVLMFLGYGVFLYALDQLAPANFREIAKTSFVSGVVVFLSVMGARYCFEVRRNHGLRLAGNFGYLYLLVALFWGVRIILALANQGTYAFDTSPVNTLVFVSIFISGVLKYMIFPMLLLQKTENDKQAQLKKTLVRANKTVTSGALSASIAHELNQPLAAIRINGQILRKTLEAHLGGQTTANGDQLRAVIDDILSENDRAAKIITSLRAIFSQSPSFGTEVDVSRLIEKTMEMVHKELEKNQIRLDLQLTGGLQVVMPEDEFHQVLLNLLFNAVHALQEPAGRHKVITIESRLVGSQAEISVSDSGPGVEQDMVDLLFDILSTSKETGMGVGLWLCKYIIERHGGSIAHAPSRLGGATFTVCLPLSPGGVNSRLVPA